MEGLKRQKLERYLASNKTLTGPFKWADKGGKTGVTPNRQDFLSDIEIDGSQIAGLRFRVSVFPNYPARITMQLEARIGSSSKPAPLYRAEVAPLREHTNPRDPKRPELSGLKFAIRESHDHHFDDAVFSTNSVELRFARRMPKRVVSFLDAVEYVCAKLKISNSGQIIKPQAQGDMLWSR